MVEPLCVERAVTGEVAESDRRSLMGWVNMPPGLISYWIQRQRAEDSDSGERGRNTLTAFNYTSIRRSEARRLELGGSVRAGRFAPDRSTSVER